MKQDPNYQRIAKIANDYGRKGVRVLSVTVQPPATAAGGEDQIIMDIDYGPKSATESWD